MQDRPIKQNGAQKAYECMKIGGLAIIPSKVGYTLIGSCEKAISKMFAIKGRPLSKPCVVLTRRDLLDELAEVPKKYIPFINAIQESKMLCGFILKRKSNRLFDSLDQYTNQNSQRKDGTSCFVINGGGYFQYLIDHAHTDGTLVVGSSANKSGTGNEGTFMNIPQNIREEVDYAIEDNAYVWQNYNPVTREQGVMVDITGHKPFIVRKGLKFTEIAKIIEEQTGTKVA